MVERLVMTHDAGDDFDHPKLAEGHPLRRHVLYRLSLTSWAKGITVREERASDIDAIYRVEVAAFHTDAEAKLVDELRSNGALTPSLVADVPGEVVGHIAFSPIFVDSDAGRMVGVGLAPMAVRPVVPRRRSRPEIFASEAARGDSPRAKSGSEAWRELARHRRRPYVRGSVTEMELAFDPLQLPLCVRVGDTSCDG